MFERVLLPALALCLWFAAPAAAQDKTIYSSLPLQGNSGPQSEDVVRAMQMALEDSGRTDVRYVSLDHGSREYAAWDPGLVSENARQIVGDESTIAVLGAFNSGASAVLIPILNEVEDILQISPSNTYVGLTRAEGAERREPRNYYPTGKRTYGRVVPADHTQAHALLAWARERGRKRVALIHDDEVYGAGLARMVRARAARYGIRIVTVQSSLRRKWDLIARRVRRARPDAMIYGGITQTGAPLLWRAVHRRNPRIDLIGPDGVAESPFTERIPRSSHARTFITNPTLDPSAYPAAGQDFLRRFRERFGREPEPYAIYGYESMALALDAFARGGNTRRGAVRAFFETRRRASVLGTYSIDRNGDTTLPAYGGYVVEDGQLAFDRVLRARP